jgi:hypothetical protein
MGWELLAPVSVWNSSPSLGLLVVLKFAIVVLLREKFYVPLVSQSPTSEPTFVLPYDAPDELAENAPPLACALGHHAASDDNSFANTALRSRAASIKTSAHRWACATVKPLRAFENSESWADEILERLDNSASVRPVSRRRFLSSSGVNISMTAVRSSIAILRAKSSFAKCTRSVATTNLLSLAGTHFVTLTAFK